MIEDLESTTELEYDEDLPAPSGGGILDVWVDIEVTRFYEGSYNAEWSGQYPSAAIGDCIGIYTKFTFDSSAVQEDLDTTFWMYRQADMGTPIAVGIGHTVNTGATYSTFEETVFIKPSAIMGYAQYFSQYLVPKASPYVDTTKVNLIFNRPSYKLAAAELKGEVKIDWLWREGNQAKIRSWVTTNLKDYNLVNYNKVKTGSNPLIESEMDRTRLLTETDQIITLPSSKSAYTYDLSSEPFWPPYYERNYLGNMELSQLELVSNAISIPYYNVNGKLYNGDYPMEVDDYVGPPEGGPNDPLPFP